MLSCVGYDVNSGLKDGEEWFDLRRLVCLELHPPWESAQSTPAVRLLQSVRALVYNSRDWQPPDLFHMQDVGESSLLEELNATVIFISSFNSPPKDAKDSQTRFY